MAALEAAITGASARREESYALANASAMGEPVKPETRR
jgi:hypothetical protein